MESEDENNYKNLKKSIESVLGVPTSDIRKKVTYEDMFERKFVSLIQTWESLRERDMELGIKFNIDFDSYNIPFYETIDTLMDLAFPNDIERKLVYFYIYERVDELGNIHPYIYEDREFIMQTPRQLLGVIKYIAANAR